MITEKVATTERNRLAFIDGVRALAALAVIFIHVFYEPTNGQYAHKFMYLFGAAYQRIPVDVFIVLSGFCLMLPVARRGDTIASWGNWFLRRARRILPPYYATVALSLLLTVAVINPLAQQVGSYVYHPLKVQAIPLYLTLLQDVFFARYGNALNNPPLWSIAVECKVYLFMPLVLLSLKRLGNAATLLWTVAFGLGIYYGLGSLRGATSPWYVALFALGAIAAREGVQGRISALWRPAALTLGVMLIAVLLWKKAAFYHAYMPYFSIAVGVVVALFLGACLRDALQNRDTIFLRALSWKPLATLGVFSYSVYLLHYPLIRVLHLVIESVIRLSPETMFLALLCGLPVYIGVAYVFHLIAERPFMNNAPAK